MANGGFILDGQGVLPITYSITGATGTYSPISDYFNKSSDFYDVAVKDGNGCIVEETIFVYEIDGPQIDDTIINPSRLWFK
jgi:hypothetical protein